MIYASETENVQYLFTFDFFYIKIYNKYKLLQPERIIL